MKKLKRNKGLKSIIINHISENIREYTIIALIFIIGIIAGVVVINNSSNLQKEELNSYISNFINALKNSENTIDKVSLLKNTIKENIILSIFLWLAGCSVIGVPIVYAIILYKGFSLSYTISALIAILGFKGIGVVFTSLFFQNIIFIPAIFALAVSGIKLYKSIIKDKKKENIKLQICRHSVYSALISIALIVTSFIEVYVSTSILENYIKII